MPAMTIDDFFGEQIINNLALFLDIPASKIKIANAVSETSKKRKKRHLDEEVDFSLSREKRAVETMELELHISNEPSANRSEVSLDPDLSFDAMDNASSILSSPEILEVGEYGCIN